MLPAPLQTFAWAIWACAAVDGCAGQAGAGWATGDSVLIHVRGMPRSGTTFVERAIHALLALTCTNTPSTKFEYVGRSSRCYCNRTTRSPWLVAAKAAGKHDFLKPPEQLSQSISRMPGEPSVVGKALADDATKARGPQVWKQLERAGCARASNYAALALCLGRVADHFQKQMHARDRFVIALRDPISILASNYYFRTDPAQVSQVSTSVTRVKVCGE